MNHIYITVLSPHYFHTFHAGRCNFYVDLRCIHSQFCIYFFFLFLHLQNQTHRNNIHNHSRIRMTHAYAIYTQPNTYTHSVYTRIHKEEAYSAEKTRRERKKNWMVRWWKNCILSSLHLEFQYRIDVLFLYAFTYYSGLIADIFH